MSSGWDLISMAGRLWRALRWRGGRLWPRVQTFLVLGQRIDPAAGAAAPSSDTRILWVGCAEDEGFEAVVRIANQQGMDRQWCAEELTRQNAIAVALVKDPGGVERPAAAGWLCNTAHGVDTILHVLDVGAAGCQLLNCLVLPEFRGRGLQRRLTQQRLRAAADAGKQWAYTVVEKSNTFSLRNALACGHRPLMRADVVRWAGLTMTFLRAMTHRIPQGTYRFRGWPASRWFHFVRWPV
jgi:ribosomal protein S18 acetylase RimI-like enzyme